MNIIIKSINFKTNSTLELFIKEKVSKLFNHCNDIIGAEISLREGQSGSPENKSCEIKLMIPGNDPIVKKTTGMYEKSVLQVVAVLKRAIRRRKSKLITQRHAINK